MPDHADPRGPNAALIGHSGSRHRLETPAPTCRFTWTTCRPGMSPGQVAALVAFLCTADARYLTGTGIVIDGGFLAMHRFQVAG
jgi:hypothetical protein